VHFSLPANGGVFFQAASGDELNLSSFYAAGFLTIDIKIDNYGTSPNLEIKLEDVDPGTSNDTKYLINNGLIPANSSWYRCNLPVSSLALDGSYLSSTSKAAYLSGEWDKMVGLDFSFTNVALINSRNISGASDCVQL